MKTVKLIFNTIKKKYNTWKRNRLLKKAIKNAKTDHLIYD
jgi:hypothetical protein